MTIYSQYKITNDIDLPGPTIAKFRVKIKFENLGILQRTKTIFPPY